MTTGPTSQCSTCRHFRSPFSRDDFEGGPFCAAFPDGIPDEVYGNRVDHRRPISGDHGVRWEPDGSAKFPEWAMPSDGDRQTNLLPRIVNEVDLAEVQRQFEQRLDDLLQQWVTITAKQRAEILDQVRLAVTSDDLAALASIHVSTTEAAEALTQAMSGMALEAAQGMSKEAARQGVRVDPVATDQSLFANIAAATAVLLAQGLTNSAGRQALRQWSVSTSGDDVVGSVREHLEALSDAFVRDHLGGALTSAQNTGRLATALSGPTASLYASEVMDRNTCPPCAAVDGKWLGNTDDPETPARVAEVYPNGGYRYCEGGVRCRGTIIGVYRPERV